MDRHDILLNLIGSAKKDIKWLDTNKTIFELEYIESSGSEYIDSGITPNQNTRVKATIFYNSTPTRYEAIFGSYESGKSFTLYGGTGGNSAYGNQTQPLSSFFNIVGDNTIDYNKNIVMINGNQHSFDEYSFTNSYNLYLFGLNNNNVVGTNTFIGGYKKCQIYDNGTLVRNFTPSYNTTTQQCGLYDTINNVWYANAGTGAFKGKLKLNKNKWKFLGSGVLTSTIVNNQLDLLPTPLNINKLIVPSEFTSIDSAGLDGIDTYLSSGLELETNCNHTKNIYTNLNDTNLNKIDVLDYKSATFTNSAFNGVNLKKFYGNNLNNFSYMTARNFLGGNLLEEITYNNLSNYTGWCIITTMSANGKAYMPKLANDNSIVGYGTTIGKLFFGGTNMVFAGYIYSQNSGKHYYRANEMASIMQQATTLGITNFTLIGIIDGADTYTSKGFSYPKLSATLTIDTNGHLIDNGVDLYDGYTANWFTDENCTTAIQPSAITNDITIYVKLA